ncbi:MAG TPA: hypothetical protein PKW49_14215, partial [Paludibacteraceae bacterium]|nr:hypothetical protein [Paludibacteraceae bacterium]HQF51302.1 hypothetical protein [Paludibacteraceae bacterium]
LYQWRRVLPLPTQINIDPKNYAKAEKALYHFKEDEVKVESNVVENPQEKELESSLNKGIE